MEKGLLVDWGLATVSTNDRFLCDDETETRHKFDKSNMTGAVKLQGTLMHMSPEQIDRNLEITNTTDIYSLGSILYETLTGVTPF